MTERPRPPEEILHTLGPVFMPALDVEIWARDVLIAEESPLWNVEHEHLRSASLGFLWTNVPLVMQGQRKIGMAQMPNAQGNKWTKERHDLQLVQWFGAKPDFLITLDGVLCDAVEDIEWCATVDHELLHCGQAKDEYGCPKFGRDDGLPKFAMRGHDVEEFVSIIQRYGVKAGAGDSAAFVKAALSKPEIGRADISRMCGTCALRLVS